MAEEKHKAISKFAILRTEQLRGYRQYPFTFYFFAFCVGVIIFFDILAIEASGCTGMGFRRIGLGVPLCGAYAAIKVVPFCALFIFLMVKARRVRRHNKDLGV